MIKTKLDQIKEKRKSLPKNVLLLQKRAQDLKEHVVRIF